MAFRKHGRQERRGPSTHVIIFGSIFVSFLLIGVWVYTSPPPIEDVAATKIITQTSNFEKPKSRSDVLKETRDTSREREHDEGSEELETEEAIDTDINDKVDEIEDRSEEVSDESVKREKEGPEVDESTILDKFMEEAKSEEAKKIKRFNSQEGKSEETNDVEGNVKEEVQVDDEAGDSESVKDSKLDVAKKEEVPERQN